MVRACVAGNFNPCHKGHIQHIQEAKKLCDYLIVITHSDKTNVKKSGYSLPLEDRVAVLKAIKGVDDVVVSIDGDGTVSETLRMIRPDKFIKGGDRLEHNMPSKEIGVCHEIGCEIVYGVGGVLNSSSKMIANVVKQLRDNGRL